MDDWLREHDDPRHGHSHSWVSLKEVLAFPWRDLMTNHRGWVNEEEFRHWLEAGGTGGPTSWCAAVSGPMIRHVDVATMTRIVRGDQEREPGDVRYYCQLEWGETYHDSCRFFCETVVPALEKLADGRPEDVRLVFWFDS